MIYLLITSFLWALSFGLVKGQLVGINPVALAVMRMGLALLVFLPFLRLRGLSLRALLNLTLIGAVQFGVMYMFYLSAFAYLQAFEVALFTVFTPLYVVLIDAILERRWRWRFLLAASLAAVGAAVVLQPSSMTKSHWLGFLLIQGANFCFAAGQLAWKRAHIKIEGQASDGQLFALPYLGGFLVTLVTSFFTMQWSSLHVSNMQILSIIYLGTVASGLCFFWWNIGAERVNAGLLAVMNNVKMPLGVALSLLIFDEKTDIPSLLLGGALIALGIRVADEKREPKPAKAAAS